MKITILGCGSSGGVPLINGDWGKCNPYNPKNRRRRASILIQYQGYNIVIDAGPDLREQLLAADVRHLDAILFTHGHADHIYGIQELRVLSQKQGRLIPLYADKVTATEIRSAFNYAVDPRDELYQPFVNLIEIEDKIQLFGVEFYFYPQEHGNQTSYSIRWQDYAYSTDFHTLPESTLDALQGLKYWLADCLQFDPHVSHSWFDRTLAYAERLRPQQTILTHMNPTLDYDEGMARAPAGVCLAYDGMVIQPAI